jgi:hypothetical protein
MKLCLNGLKMLLHSKSPLEEKNTRLVKKIKSAFNCPKNLKMTENIFGKNLKMKLFPKALFDLKVL